MSGTVNRNAGNLVVDVLTIREGMSVRTTLVTKRTTLTENLTLGGNANLTLNTLIASEVSSEDIDRFAYASTDVDTSVNIDPVGATEGWDVTSVSICGCPGSGALQSVNPTTGVITYDPASGYTGVDVFHYTIVDDESNTRTVYQNIAVFDPATAPFVNNATFGKTQQTGAPPFTYSYDIKPYVIENTNPIDYTSLVLSGTVWDPTGTYLIGDYPQGPFPTGSMQIPSTITHVGNGIIELVVPTSALNERSAQGKYQFKVKVSDTFANEGNVATFDTTFSV